MGPYCLILHSKHTSYTDCPLSIINATRRRARWLLIYLSRSVLAARRGHTFEDSFTFRAASGKLGRLGYRRPGTRSQSPLHSLSFSLSSVHRDGLYRDLQTIHPACCLLPRRTLSSHRHPGSPRCPSRRLLPNHTFLATRSRSLPYHLHPRSAALCRQILYLAQTSRTYATSLRCNPFRRPRRLDLARKLVLRFRVPPCRLRQTGPCCRLQNARRAMARENRCGCRRSRQG